MNQVFIMIWGLWLCNWGLGLQVGHDYNVIKLLNQFLLSGYLHLIPLALCPVVW